MVLGCTIVSYRYIPCIVGLETSRLLHCTCVLVFSQCMWLYGSLVSIPTYTSNMDRGGMVSHGLVTQCDSSTKSQIRFGTQVHVQCCVAIVIPTVFHPRLDILDPYPYPYPYPLSRTHTHIYGLVPIPVPVPMTLSHVVPVPIPVPMVSYPYPYPWSRTRTRTHTHGLVPIPVPVPMIPYPHYKSGRGWW